MKWSRWRDEQRQRRYHRAFRIAEPQWGATGRARLTRLLDELAAATQPVESAVITAGGTGTKLSTRDSGSALDDKDLAEAATNLWRARRRIVRLGEENSREGKRVGRYLLATQEALDQAGLVIQDHDGVEVHPGLSLEVLATQSDPALRSEVVQETVRPSVYLAGRRIQTGQVIVGCPAGQDTTTGEQRRA